MGQTDWRCCHKCQGLFFHGNPSKGVCPKDHLEHSAYQKHSAFGSRNYSLALNTPSAPGQNNWRLCNKCQGLYFAGHTTHGQCPTGGTHDHTGSGNYSLLQNAPGSPGQEDWRWCPVCEGLYFAGNSPSRGVCPGGGEHGGSANYKLVQV
jgi:hypothetical protein